MLGLNIYLLVCAISGVGYGFYQMFTHKPPLYFQIIVLAIESMVYARIFYLVNLLFYGGLPEEFNLGFVGFAAFLLFLFFANYGQIDLLVDDRKSFITKYRLIPLVVPILEILISLLALSKDDCTLSVRVSYLLLSAIAGGAGYLNLKHLIIPDVKGGIVYSIRGFNVVCLVMEVLTLAEIGLYCFGRPEWMIGVEVVLGVLYLLVLPLLYREVSRWTR